MKRRKNDFISLVIALSLKQRFNCVIIIVGVGSLGCPRTFWVEQRTRRAMCFWALLSRLVGFSAAAVADIASPLCPMLAAACPKVTVQSDRCMLRTIMDRAWCCQVSGPGGLAAVTHLRRWPNLADLLRRRLSTRSRSCGMGGMTYSLSVPAAAVQARKLDRSSGH